MLTEFKSSNLLKLKEAHIQGSIFNMFKLNQGLLLIPRITILCSIINTRTCTFTNKLFSTLNSETFADNTGLRIV